MARKKRAVPEINAGSMADIAFLLLIFFLVTTTMDADKGINRKLPPWDPENEITPPDIKKKNILTVVINSNNQLLVNDDYLDISELRKSAIAFLINNGDGSCTYCQDGLRSPESSDNPFKAIMSIQNDKGTSYDMYIKVQNELVGAYEDLRNQLAQKKFGKDFAELTDEAQISEVRDAFPQVISEAEPLNIGG